MREFEFLVDDRVFLKAAPMNGILHLGKKRKLKPMFIGLFEILKCIGIIGCQLALPHNFQLCMLFSMC